jgi:hypothetical protein
MTPKNVHQQSDGQTRSSHAAALSTRTVAIKTRTRNKQAIVFLLILSAAVLRYVQLTGHVMHETNDYVSRNEDGFLPPLQHNITNATKITRQSRNKSSQPPENPRHIQPQPQLRQDVLQREIKELQFDDEFFQNSSHTEKRRPYFILHVGPPKTATTSIQCGLNEHSGRLAQQDNYYYLGRSCPSTPQIMDNGMDPIKPLPYINNMGLHQPQFLQEMRQLFVDQLRQGHNLILSTEHIASKGEHQISNPFLWKKLLQGFSVKVVVAYRHYFEWYPSFYYQEHLRDRFRTQWPDEGGKPMPSLLAYLQDHLDVLWDGAAGRPQNTPPSHRNTTHMSLWMYLTWSKVFEDVQLLDLHHPGDVLVQFVCQALPGAVETCAFLKEEQETPKAASGQTKVHRVSKNHFAERVVDAALAQGMIPDTTNITKRHVTKRVASNLEKLKLLSIPEYLWCPDSVLEGRLRNASLSFLHVFHTTATAKNQLHHHQNWTLASQEHNKLFEQAKTKLKFCDINVTRVLRNDHFVRRVFGKTSQDSTTTTMVGEKN